MVKISTREREKCVCVEQIMEDVGMLKSLAEVQNKFGES